MSWPSDGADVTRKKAGSAFRTGHARYVSSAANAAGAAWMVKKCFVACKKLDYDCAVIGLKGITATAAAGAGTRGIIRSCRNAVRDSELATMTFP